MSKYDELDASMEIEQEIAKDLKKALTKRGYSVKHNGAKKTHAPGNKADIEIKGEHLCFTVEVTKAQGAAQDREFNAIKEHLFNYKETIPQSPCFCLYISPKTPSRMIDTIMEYNQTRKAAGINDLTIIPLNFELFEFWIMRLIESEADVYTIEDLTVVANHFEEIKDDTETKRLFSTFIFPNDPDLRAEIDRDDAEASSKTLENLIKDLTRLEDYMRESGIAVSQAAIDTLIHLVFLKLYEEKRESKGDKNRLKNKSAYMDFISNGVSASIREEKTAIHKLFSDAKSEREFREARLFTDTDVLPDGVNDDFILENVIPVFSKYVFYGSKIDALGAVYEILALRADKDIKVGQFFTPVNVVNFMTGLAELSYDDKILDPACGTGRFLIYAMDYMKSELTKSSCRDKDKKWKHIVREQLFGTDIDPRIAKIAKMNMWIHGDGKSNIQGGKYYNGLTLNKNTIGDGRETYDNYFDCILTNPPLGELNYQVLSFDPFDEEIAQSKSIAKKYERMPILPVKYITEEKWQNIKQEIAELNVNIKTFKEREARLLSEKIVIESSSLSKSALKKLITQDEILQEYQKLTSDIKRMEKFLHAKKEKEEELHKKLLSGDSELVINGAKMKGGAMFLVSIWHYLKDIAYPDQRPEWRGGKVLAIIDEGILNTENYRGVREFIKSHYYIKAIISLSRDTFVPISNTTTKTSIIYLVKKTDKDAVQKEPVFFAHCEKVGMTTVGNACKNDLPDIKKEYFKFKENVLNAYVGNEFVTAKFRWEGKNYA